MPIAHILYAIALLTSSALLFGAAGIVTGAIILGVWAFIFYSDDRPKALLAVIFVAIFGSFILSLFTPAANGRGISRRIQCKNNLKIIGLALHNYHDDHGSFPPAYIADENGKPMHSWRVLLLPYLDEPARYREYDFSKPWDSPENLELLKHRPSVFACLSHIGPTEDLPHTSYVAVVGPETAWPGSGSSKFSEMNDGTSNIVMVIESHSPEIRWTEPRDLTVEEAVEVLASEDFESFSGHRSQSFFYEYLGGRHVLFGDGSVRFAPAGTSRSLAAQLMTINDGLPGNDWDLADNATVPHERLKWDVVILFTVFVVLAFLPVPWIWLNPTSKRTGPPQTEAPPKQPSDAGQ